MISEQHKVNNNKEKMILQESSRCVAADLKVGLESGNGKPLQTLIKRPKEKDSK